jgi:outer membrane protein
MRYIFNSLVIIIVFSTTADAQKKWSLLDCVNYAMANNITIKQTSLQTNLTELQYKQSKLSQYPNASFSTGGSFNSGRNQDPTTFALITQNYLAANAQLQTSADIFNWFSKKNTIAANGFEVEATKASTDKLKNDIALSVANAYLQILLAKEQQKIADVQLQQSKAQLINTRKLVTAGSLPELNAAELEAQVARDSANLISAKGSVEQGLLSLKSNMGFDAATEFEIDTPPADKIFVEKIGDLLPESVYALAIANMPQQRVNDFKLKAAEKTKAAAKGSMYPTISGFGSLSSSYIALRSPAYERIFSSYNPTGLKTSVGGTLYDVLTPSFTQGNKVGYNNSAAFGTQIEENFRKSIGVSINVPIFNGGSLKTNYERSKINIKSLQLQKDLDNQKLKQDIYQAYNAAVVALEKYNASKKTVETAERSYGFANKRYAIGMLTTLELITNQNNLLRAKLEYSLNEFDYVFKMKVLEFYKGMGLKF